MSLRRSLVAVGLLLALAACGGGSAEGDAEGEAAPLEEFFGHEDDPGWEQFAERERLVQELIIACMAKEGFTYLPVTYDEFLKDPAVAAQVELPPEEYARQYGYGVTTAEFDTLTGRGFSDDPNGEIVGAMGKAEQDAYYQALYGDIHPLDLNGYGAGCQGDAAKKVHGRPGTDTELGAEYEELAERIKADPRMVAATRAWSECMAEAGYDFSEPEQEPLFYVMDKHSKVLEEAAVNRQASTEPPLEGEEFAESDLDEATLAELAELREEEIAIAVADQACAAEHLSSVRQEVTAEYEQAFIEENRGALERVRDARAGG